MRAARGRTFDERRRCKTLQTQNVSRVVTPVATRIAIFAFLLFFLYPRYFTGEVDAILFRSHRRFLEGHLFSRVCWLVLLHGHSSHVTERRQETDSSWKRRLVLAARLSTILTRAESDPLHRSTVFCGSHVVGAIAFVLGPH